MYRCEHCDLELATVVEVLLHVLHHLARLEKLMTEINADQAHLDADVQAENDAIAIIEAEIAAFKAVPLGTPLDFTALDNAVARLRSDAPPAVTPPATSTAAPADSTGVVGTQNVADDGTVAPHEDTAPSGS